jgi:hypothetical protein
MHLIFLEEMQNEKGASSSFDLQETLFFLTKKEENGKKVFEDFTADLPLIPFFPGLSSILFLEMLLLLLLVLSLHRLLNNLLLYHHPPLISFRVHLHLHSRITIKCLKSSPSFIRPSLSFSSHSKRCDSFLKKKSFHLLSLLIFIEQQQTSKTHFFSTNVSFLLINLTFSFNRQVRNKEYFTQQIFLKMMFVSVIAVGFDSSSFPFLDNVT